MLRRALVLTLLLLAVTGCRRRDKGAPAFRPIETGVPVGPTRSAGCRAPAAAARGETFTVRGRRAFHVWGSTSSQPERAHPIVFAYHGWGSTGRQFQRWFRMEDFVGDGAFVVYPDAQGTWDVGGDADLDAFEAALDAIGGVYCVDRARVFAFGFSYGGKLVSHLGCRRGAKLRAIAIGDGSLAWESGCRPIPVLVTHRTRDDDELIEGGRAAAQRWADANGCEGKTDLTIPAYGCSTYRGCKPDGAVTFCEDTDDNPTWPRRWHHTVREEYRALTWAWFQSVR